MCRVNRGVLAFAVAVVALFPVTAGASSPSPMPSLDSILLKPPTTDFVELTTAPLHGEFTAHDWATDNNSTDTQTLNTLNREGFVDGFGQTWTSASSQHDLIEAVMAFSGGGGAKRVLTALETSDKAAADYSHADSITGVSPAYGVHFFDQTNAVYGDLFGFVKGNDLFLVIFQSAKDDVLTLASTQARSQFDSAPDSTIPSSQWPENAHSASASFPVGVFGGAVAFVVVVVASLAFLIMRRRGATPMPVGAYPMPGTPGAGSTVQMSPDGNYWWDGQAWKDATLEAPPGAQRSTDGTLWWDGQKWRPIGPGPQEPPPAWPS
jgi:hypothetical protein